MQFKVKVKKTTTKYAIVDAESGAEAISRTNDLIFNGGTPQYDESITELATVEAVGYCPDVE